MVLIIKNVRSSNFVVCIKQIYYGGLVGMVSQSHLFLQVMCTTGSSSLISVCVCVFWVRITQLGGTCPHSCEWPNTYISTAS